MTGALADDRLTAGQYWRLTAAYGFSSIQFWMTVPLAALVLSQRGVEAWKIGLLGSVPWVVLAAMLPFVPGLAARFGALAVFRGGLGLGLAGATAFAVSEHLVLWVLGYALCGAGIALRWIVADGLIAALAPRDKRGHYIGLFESIVGSTLALGPLVLVVTGTEGKTAFLVGLALVVAALPPAALLRLADGRGGAVPSLPALLRGMGRAPLAMVAAVAAGVIEGAATKLFPVQAVGMGLGEALAAATVTAFGAGNLLTQYPVGRLCDRLSQHRVASGVLLLMAALALAVPAVAGSPVAYLGVLAGIGGLAGSLYTLAVFDAGHSGTALESMTTMAGIGIAYTAGSMLGPPLAGAATSASLAWGLPLVVAAVSLAGLACLRLLPAALLGRPAADTGSP